ncbi:MAG: MerR family transcriptional regulator [Patescibacteria group bacterium]|jgi:DNA-binding transcriptional MerR regulator
MNNLITAGELARLAGTTKRTIHFYDEKGVLKPVKITKTKYRLYEEHQIIDYQLILLLSTLGVSLNEMKEYLKKRGNLFALFSEKRGLIEKEIESLGFNLRNLTKFQENLEANGTMVNPQLKVLPSFGVYYIERTGSYASIGKYCDELRGMFAEQGADFTTLAIFEEQGYKPKRSHIRIGALSTDGMRIMPEFRGTVKFYEFAPGKVLTYTHNGSGSLLSYFWKELEKFAGLNKLKPRTTCPDFEIYRKVSVNPSQQFFEIYLPIE